MALLLRFEWGRTWGAGIAAASRRSFGTPANEPKPLIKEPTKDCPSSPRPSTALSLFDLEWPRLKDLITSLSLPAFRAAQVWDGMYAWASGHSSTSPNGIPRDVRPALLRGSEGTLSWEALTTLSPPQRLLLSSSFSPNLPVARVKESVSADGTVKWLFEVGRNPPPPPSGGINSGSSSSNISSSGSSSSSGTAASGGRGSGGSGKVVEAVFIPEWRGRASRRVTPSTGTDHYYAPDDDPDDEGDEDDDGDNDVGGGRGMTSRGTLCVSSQVGCSLACSFCHTGTQRFMGNLSPGEIVGQYQAAKEALLSSGGSRGGRTYAPITNIVFMGQGEPLYNWTNVAAAIRILSGGSTNNNNSKNSGYNGNNNSMISPRRIMVSTSGVAPVIPRLARETPGVRLAISLHAPTDTLRSEIMGINKTYDIATLLAAVREYIAIRQEQLASSTSTTATSSGGNNMNNNKNNSVRRVRVTFEYTLLKGVNDSPTHARQLAELLVGGPHALPLGSAHVNLIPFNSWTGTSYTPSPPETIEAFSTLLSSEARRLSGRSPLAHSLKTPPLIVTTRKTRGSDIGGACGQLRSSEDLKKRPLLK